MRPLLPEESPTGAVALRVAYDGAAFAGSQRQPNARTVDGALLRALDAIGANARQFRSGSRTDAGVSATGNVVCFETEFPHQGLCGALNSEIEDAWCVAWADVPTGFAPRRAARSRTYRYFLPAAGLDAARVAEALAAFEGEHDFSAFARVEAHRSPRRVVKRATARAAGEFLAIDVEGVSFLWNQVRRMVAAAAAAARGEVDVATIRRALAEGRGPDLGLVPAEGLLLVDVDVGVGWRRVRSAEARAARQLAERALGLRRHAAALDALRDEISDARP